MATPAQPAARLPTCPMPDTRASSLLLQSRSGIQGFWGGKKSRLSKEVRPTQQLLKITPISQFRSLLLRKHVTFDLFPFQVSLAFSFLCNLIVKQLPVNSSACNCWLPMSSKAESTTCTPTSAPHKKQISLTDSLDGALVTSTRWSMFPPTHSSCLYTCGRLPIAWVIMQRLTNSSLSLC